MGADMRKLDSLAADPDWNGIFHVQPAASVLRDELRRAVSHHTKAFGSTGTLARIRAARVSGAVARPVVGRVVLGGALRVGDRPSRADL